MAQKRDLPAERLRDTVVLVAGEQLTHAEAAAVLGASENTIAWRMHEARRILPGLSARLLHLLDKDDNTELDGSVFGTFP